MAKTERVNATINSNTKKDLEKLSAKTGVSQSEIINIAIQEHLKLMSTKDIANKKAYAVLKEGFLEEDIFKLFPKDLDFNKDY